MPALHILSLALAAACLAGVNLYLTAFLAGHSRRAPLWMQRAGLEWAFRAMQEPSRLGWRYLVTNPHALWRILIDNQDKPPRGSADAGGSVTPAATGAGLSGPVKRNG